MQSAASRAIARRERVRLLGFLAAGGIADDPAPWLRRVERAAQKALAKREETTASQLSDDVPELKERLLLSPGKKYEAVISISGRVLLLLAAEGRVVRGRPRGSWISTQYRWTTAEHWLGAPIVDVPVDVARADLLRRWLRAFGPGTVSDLEVKRFMDLAEPSTRAWASTRAPRSATTSAGPWRSPTASPSRGWCEGAGWSEGADSSAVSGHQPPAGLIARASSASIIRASVRPQACWTRCASRRTDSVASFAARKR